MGVLVEVLEERCGHLDQTPFCRGAHAEREHLSRQAVPGVVFREQSGCHQVSCDSVQRALGQAGAAHQFGEPEVVIIGGERLKNRERLAEHARDGQIGLRRFAIVPSHVLSLVRDSVSMARGRARPRAGR